MPILQTSGTGLSAGALLGSHAGRWWIGVVRRVDGKLDFGVRLAENAALTGLWRDPDGTLWVCGEDGRVHHSADPWGPDAGGWHVQEMDCSLTGIIGVHGRCVLASGVRASDGVHVLRWFNGRSWNAIGSPGFAIRAMHLVDENHIWVAGDGVARWDGEGWETLETPPIVAMHAPRDDRVVVVLQDGQICRVTPEGLHPLDRIEGACAVAVWRERIWVGAGQRGLWRLGGGERACVRADRHCVSLEAHAESLMIGCTEVMAYTEDGEAFPAALRGVLEQLP